MKMDVPCTQAIQPSHRVGAGQLPVILPLQNPAGGLQVDADVVSVVVVTVVLNSAVVTGCVAVTWVVVDSAVIATGYEKNGIT